jgi:hypothetical protein
VLISVLGSFLVSRTCDVEQSVDTGLYGVCALVSKLEGLLRIGSVLVDHFVDQIVDR